MRFLLYSLLWIAVTSFPVSAQEINSFFQEELGEIDFDFGRWPYPLYEENGARLRVLADQYPGIATLHVIGQTQQGRDMLLMEITNKSTGPGEDKPGMWLDGNMHASEVNGRPTMMYFIERALSRYGKDEKVTRLVDTRAFYVLPMFDADGGERVLTRHPAWPEHKPEQHNGKDLDGDGFISQMRKKDPNGRFYESRKDSRLMLNVRRRNGSRDNYFPTTYSDTLFFNWQEPDIGWKRISGDLEPFDDPMVPHEDRYAVYTEGQSFETVVNVDPLPQNFNRGWSAEWDASIRNSGPFPFYIPELRAAVKFITDHKNIFFHYNIHADNQAKNYIVRPPMDHPYEFMPPEDNEFYVRLGQDWAVISNGDLKIYETCPRQYQFFREYDFTPSRSAVIFFGRHVDRLLLYWTSEARKEDALMVLPYDPRRVDEVGRHFDETVRRIQSREFAVTIPPEAAICKECDLKMLCHAEGIISREARG